MGRLELSIPEGIVVSLWEIWIQDIYGSKNARMFADKHFSVALSQAELPTQMQWIELIDDLNMFCFQWIFFLFNQICLH